MAAYLYRKNRISCALEAVPVTSRGSPFQAAAALYGNCRRATARRTRGKSITAEPAAAARVALAETAARGRNIARSESGAPAAYRARCTFTASLRAITSPMLGQPSAPRAGVMRSNLRRPETSRAAKCMIFCFNWDECPNSPESHTGCLKSAPPFAN